MPNNSIKPEGPLSPDEISARGEAVFAAVDDGSFCTLQEARAAEEAGRTLTGIVVYEASELTAELAQD